MKFPVSLITNNLICYGGGIQLPLKRLPDSSLFSLRPKKITSVFRKYDYDKFFDQAELTCFINSGVISSSLQKAQESFLLFISDLGED